MMRDTRTLKGLFPDPKPPRRKNFIKENVKNLRRMEQLFHTNNQSAKDLKLPVLKQRKSLSKHNGASNNQISNGHEDEKESKAEKSIENEMSKSSKQKSFHEDQNNRKKSAPVLSNKRITPKKLARPSVNTNMTRKSQGVTEQEQSTNKNRDKLKARSDGDVALEKLNETLIDNDGNLSRCRNQSVQTLDVEEIDSLYSEGVIRYPSGRSTEIQKPKLSDRGDTVQVSDYSESGDKHDSERSVNGSTNRTKANKERVPLASKLVSQLNHGAPPSSYRVGVVPKYIKERKEALQKEQSAKAAAKHSDCPSGHVPLPDHERKETLSMLKKNYQEYVSELNMLPIRTDTLRSQKRKMEIEKQLNKLEEAIKVFSRPKVFVKVDS